MRIRAFPVKRSICKQSSLIFKGTRNPKVNSNERDTKVRPEMSEIMTFLEIAGAEKIGKILFLASTI